MRKLKFASVIDGVLGGDFVEVLNETECLYDGVLCEYEFQEDMIGVYKAGTNELITHGALMVNETKEGGNK